jgi:hypothetical protein
MQVVSPKDIFEQVNGELVKVARKGERISIEQAKKYKILPIASSDLFNIETK